MSHGNLLQGSQNILFLQQYNTLVTLSQENLLQYTYNIYYQTFQQTLDDLSSMQYSDL